MDNEVDRGHRIKMETLEWKQLHMNGFIKINKIRMAAQPSVYCDD